MVSAAHADHAPRHGCLNAPIKFFPINDLESSACLIRNHWAPDLNAERGDDALDHVPLGLITDGRGAMRRGTISLIYMFLVPSRECTVLCL